MLFTQTQYRAVEHALRRVDRGADETARRGLLELLERDEPAMLPFSN